MMHLFHHWHLESEAMGRMRGCADEQRGYWWRCCKCGKRQWRHWTWA